MCDLFSLGAHEPLSDEQAFVSRSPVCCSRAAWMGSVNMLRLTDCRCLWRSSFGSDFTGLLGLLTGRNAERAANRAQAVTHFSRVSF
jgi:hypothetical protein